MLKPQDSHLNLIQSKIIAVVNFENASNLFFTSAFS